MGRATIGRGRRLLMNGQSLNSKHQPMSKEVRDWALIDAIKEAGPALYLLENAINHREPFEVLERRMARVRRLWNQVNVLAAHKDLTEER